VAAKLTAAELVQAASAVYGEVEGGIRTTIARYLRQGLGEPGWATSRLAAAGSLRSAVSAIAAGLATRPLAVVAKAISTGWDDGAAGALARVSAAWFRQSGLSAAAMAAKEQIPRDRAIAALIGEVAGQTRSIESAILRQSIDAYRGVIAAATAQSIGSGVTNQVAMSRAWRSFVDQGITGFTDSAGRRWQLPTYVEMSVRTGTARASTLGAQARCESAGLDLLLATGHSQSCPHCAPYQGRILRRGDGPIGNVRVRDVLTGKLITVYVVATLADAQAAGFQHPNCRHGVTGFVPGATRMEDPPVEDPEAYAARMRQRELERRLRAAKARADSALTSEDQQRANQRVRHAKAALTDHIDANGLKRLPSRERPGLGITGSQSGTGTLNTPEQGTLL
jgi:hypothetical protein